MGRLFSKKTTKVGAIPGTLVITKESPKPRIRIIRYTADERFDEIVESVDAIQSGA